MSNELRINMQSFRNLMEGDLKTGREGQSVQVGANGNIGKATKTSSAFNRFFAVTKSSRAAIQENNKIRTQFLRAVLGEFQGLESLPESVKEALNVKDFGLERTGEGKLVVRSGKPLTMRRIQCVITAIDEYRQREELGQLKEKVKTPESGKTFSPVELEIRSVLVSNPLLVKKGGVVNSLGFDLAACAKSRFEAQLTGMTNSQKVKYLRNYQTHAREAATFVNNLVLNVEQKIKAFFDSEKGQKVLRAPCHGEPPNERRIEARKSVFLASLLNKTIVNRLNVGGRDSADRMDMDSLLGQIDSWLDGKGFCEECRYLGALNDTTLDGEEELVDICLQFEDAVKDQFDVDVPKSVSSGVVQSANNASFIGESEEKISQRVTGFVEMFRTSMEISKSDKEVGMKLFTKLVDAEIAKPFFVKGAKDMIDMLANVKLELPTPVTAESLNAFCRDLAEKTYDKGKQISESKQEFGNQDLRDLYISFTMTLVETRQDVKEWFAGVSEAKVNDLVTHIDENLDGSEVGDVAKNNFINMAMCHIASALSTSKVLD